jgi:phosphoglycolate phosphatase
VEAFLTKHDITVFDSLQSDTGLFGKDKAIKKFLRQNAITKERVMYVGDEIRDIQACQKAGVKIIAVTWGFNSREGLEMHHPDFLIDRPSDILRIVTDRFK